MLFFIYHEDRDNADEVRRANRPDHLAYMAQYQVLFAGPTLSEDGERMTGSVIMIDVADRAAAEECVRNDPYVKAGLFKATTIKRWRKTIPADPK